MRRTCAALFLIAATLARADEGWDAQEARFLRDQLYLQIEHLPDFASIKQTFEKAIVGDASAASELATLVRHSNEDVAGAAAQALGRFPSEAASVALRNAYTNNGRFTVRVNALAGLARMRDPATANLALAALNDENVIIQGGGLGALEGLGDSAYSTAILQYMDRQSPGEADGDLLLAVGKLGDPPGSTAVRDRLVSEANKKTNPFDVRYGAARGLKEMGLANLVKPIFDIACARNTNDSLIVVKGAMVALAAKRGITVKGQGDVDTLLRDIQVGRHKEDTWGRPLRAKFVSQGVFHVVSDGPDTTPDTTDDMSTAETLDAYLDRIFPDQFMRP
jgi:hypothetical protein